MINAVYHDKPLIFTRATFWVKLVLHNQAVNEADSCLHMSRAASKAIARTKHTIFVGCYLIHGTTKSEYLFNFKRDLNYNLLQGYAPSIVNQLTELSEAGVEELRVLQTILILITTSSIVQRQSLAKVSDQTFSLQLRMLLLSTISTPVLYLYCSHPFTAYLGCTPLFSNLCDHSMLPYPL